jgi:CheY-like chemotaxis protein
MSGFDALRILQDDAATSRIPVMALSANAMPRDVERGMAAGFFRYLTKPVRVHEFFDALTEALNVAADRRARHDAFGPRA